MKLPFAAVAKLVKFQLFKAGKHTEGLGVVVGYHDLRVGVVDVWLTKSRIRLMKKSRTRNTYRLTAVVEAVSHTGSDTAVLVQETTSNESPEVEVSGSRLADTASVWTSSIPAVTGDGVVGVKAGVCG